MLPPPRPPPCPETPTTRAGRSQDDDFGLIWVQDRIGWEEVRRFYVLACAGWPGDRGNVDHDLRHRLRALVERFGGRLEQSADGVPFALWGASRTGAQDARLAGLAALAIVHECGEPDAALRCGIVSAQIAVRPGTMGQDVVLDGDALQAAIERGSHIAAQSTRRAVLASDDVIQAMGVAFEVVPLETREAVSAHAVYRIVARRPGYIDSLSEAAPRVIGRARELGLLQRAWRAVRDGAGHTAVLITGDAGIGKTALVGEARWRCADEGALTVLVTCTPEARAGVAAPVGDLLNRLWYRAGQSAVPGIEARGGSGSWDFGGAVAAVLALARQRPIALFVEDLHWADEPSAAFLNDLAGHVAAGASGLLLTMTGRTVPASLDLQAVKLVQLDPLGPADVMAIVDDAGLGGCSVAERDEIAACAGGSPFLALELARALPAAGRGRIAPWGEDRGHGPASLYEVLELRLAMLGPLKPLAQAASIFPSQISAGVLAQMLAVDVRWLESRLAELEDAGVLGVHTGRRGRWFRFKHALLREAAYDSIPAARRSELNRLAAEALAERSVADRLIEPAAVAHHFAAAGCREEAFTWWRRAADKASSEALLQAAVLYLRRALAIANDSDSAVDSAAVVETLRQLGVALIQARGSAEPEVRATYERALSLASAAAGVPDELRFDLLWGFDAFLLAGGEVRRAAEIGEELLETARRIGSRQKLMLARRMHAVAMLLTGKIREAEALYREAIESYDETSDAPLRFAWASDQRVVAHAHLCWALSIKGDVSGAELHARQALEVAGRLGHAHSSAHALGVLAMAAQIRGDRGAAGAYAVAGRAVAVRNNFPYWVAWNDIVLGWVAGGPMPEHGIRSVGDAIARYEATGARQALPYAWMLLAEAELRRGDPRRALDAVAKARRGSAQGISLWDSELDRLEAAARRALGCGELSGGLIGRAVATATEQGAMTFAMRCSAANVGWDPAPVGAFSRIEG